MKKNLGSTDRVMRVLIFLAVTALIFTNVLTGAAAIVIGTIALALLLTSLFGFCPIYYLLKLKTTKKAA